MLENEEHLEELLARPSGADQDLLRRLTGDVIVVGAGGKMGPSLVRRIRRAADAASVEAPRRGGLPFFIAARPAVTWSARGLKPSRATCWIRSRSPSCLRAKTFFSLRAESLARRIAPT